MNALVDTPLDAAPGITAAPPKAIGLDVGDPKQC